MEFNPKKFSEVAVNSNEQNPCSPDSPEDPWYGILINGPKEVIINKGEGNIFIPICGFYQVKTINLLKSHPLKLCVMLEGRDDLFSGFMIESSSDPDAPDPDAHEINPKDVENQVSLSYFNPDLLKYVNIPLINGKYLIFVEFGGMKSNLISIKIEIKE